MAADFSRAEFVLSAVTPAAFLRDGLPQVAFAGRSNVGKSSVINRITGRKNFARVGASPGKTSQINYFRIQDRGYLVDLPGYGYAKVGKAEKLRWAELIEGYLQDDSRELALVVLLIDMRHPPTRLDLDMVNYLLNQELPFVIILTKADKLNRTQYRERLEAFSQEIPEGDQIVTIPFSAETGEGVDALRQILEELAEYYQTGGENSPEEE